MEICDDRGRRLISLYHKRQSLLKERIEQEKRMRNWEQPFRDKIDELEGLLKSSRRLFEQRMVTFGVDPVQAKISAAMMTGDMARMQRINDAGPGYKSEEKQPEGPDEVPPEEVNEEMSSYEYDGDTEKTPL